LMRHMCLGLECAHQGIKIDGKHCQVIHRDIKPSNAFVISDPSLGTLAKVLDFGIAQFLSDTTESNQTGSFMGTLAYCSPEQIAGKDLDHRSDIYSLGVTMFEVLTGHIPIQAETNSIGSWYHAHRSQVPKTFDQVAPGLTIPASLNDLIMSCMAKSPDERPQSMTDILAVIQALIDSRVLSRIAVAPLELLVFPLSLILSNDFGLLRMRVGMFLGLKISQLQILCSHSY